MKQAIEFEARRQIEVIEDGKTIVQETRLYDPERNETRAMRSKEDAQDYRYFPDPDLLPLVITDEDIARVRAQMPRGLDEIREELRAVYASIAPATLSVITASAGMASDSSQALKSASGDTCSVVANLVAGPLSSRLNHEGLDISQCRISPDSIRKLAERIADGTISNSAAVSTVLPAMWLGEGSPEGFLQPLSQHRARC